MARFELITLNLHAETDTNLSQNSRSLDQNLNMKFLELKSEIATTSVNLSSLW
jgi:hypothetical protein